MPLTADWTVAACNGAKIAAAAVYATQPQYGQPLVTLCLHMHPLVATHLGGAASASTAYVISGSALVKVNAPASALMLTQRWQDTARSALISTTRPSVTSRQAMPMLGLQWQDILQWVV